jgi:integrase
MRKTGTPWYRSTHDAWYVWHEGRQVPLAKGKENTAEAFARFAEVLGAPPRQAAPPPSPTADQLVTAYLDDLRGRVKATTLTAYECVLKSFLKRLADCDAGSLEPNEAERWATQQEWSQTTRRYALTVVGGLTRWAARTGHLTENPLVNLKRPAGRSRGAEILVGRDLHDRLLGVVSPEFGRFLVALWGTGARPGEVARVEAAHVVWEASCWILPDHKTVGKTGRERVIHVPADVLEQCRNLARQHPTGVLFRTTRGEPWRKTSWKQAMARAQKKLGLPRRPMASGYRHSFATTTLEVGVPDAHVAELLGHTSTAMIHRHYSHLGVQSEGDGRRTPAGAVTGRGNRLKHQ